MMRVPAAEANVFIACAKRWPMSSCHLVILSSCHLLLFAGCDAGTAPLTPVRGQVFYQGRPLTHGLIVFTPDVQRGGKGASAAGEIQADGSYTLTTDGQPGAACGWHRITIAALEPGLAGKAGQNVAPPRALPARYSDPELSGEIREVKPGKENIIDFQLDR